MAEFRGIVRLSNKTLQGELPLPKALMQIKGLGAAMADILSKRAAQKFKVAQTEQIGNLSEEQTEALEQMINDPIANKIPTWMLNRKRNFVTGKDEHLVMSDLDYRHRLDIQFLQDTRTYRGIRHMHGLTCRGQRTKTSGRHGHTMGVTKKKR